MPEYVYTCTQGHEWEITERMLYGTARVCETCSEVMHRKPHALAVTWGGLKPSQGEYSDTVKDLLATETERREVYKMEHPK